MLVLSGVSAMDELYQFGYRPFVILDGVFEIPDASKTDYVVSTEELEEAERRVSLLLSKYLFIGAVLAHSPYFFHQASLL